MKKNSKKYNSELTNADKPKLGERAENQRNDHKGDEAQLENRSLPVDFTAKNLDIPGRTNATLANNNLKDEENEHYSQGSGHNDHLEDAKNHL